MGSDGAGRGSNFLRVVILLSFLCFVSAEILENRAAKTVTKTVTGTTNIQLDTRRIIETERQGTKLNYVSKRRVPIGPDPIHNRKAGEHMETRIRA
ncbi:CLAVATA3/ESR (CLE)-related protein 25-like [Lycium ferocissimum]|uniref:CLAVATA3/ESR (CLE)-related protein 25-like n=1 Tax=Lycium ferocissimum TaxID=112874 RepID=UPI00281658EC|nr:CLAVATA3/ESR (CLE)-related protein 25-like [Lycium ferocissimum]